jgi:hypothetical protein
MQSRTSPPIPHVTFPIVRVANLNLIARTVIVFLCLFNETLLSVLNVKQVMVETKLI